MKTNNKHDITKYGGRKHGGLTFYPFCVRLPAGEVQLRTDCGIVWFNLSQTAWSNHVFVFDMNVFLLGTMNDEEPIDAIIPVSKLLLRVYA